MTKTEIKDIVNSEVKKVLKQILKDEIVKQLKNKENKDVLKDVTKEALINFYRFLWTQRSVWENKI
jgi:Na+-translocating ferredoxin:NAD+ oxidoreductase RnfG subunit